MRSRPPLVGILGGMGPQATVDFYDKLVRHTPAKEDQDHLRVAIWADPTVPSRQAALLGDGKDPTPSLQEGLDHLTELGADLIVVPCNTVHVFVLPLIEKYDVAFISIIDATVAAVALRNPAAVGILATEGALSAGLFQAALDRAGLPWVLPSAEDQHAINGLVDAVKAGAVDGSHVEEFRRVLLALAGEGADVCIAGCTELSTLAEALPSETRAGVVDPSRELALATIDWVRQGPTAEV